MGITDLFEDAGARPQSRLAADLLPVLARQRLMQGQPWRIGLCVVWYVVPGWETDVLRMEEAVIKVSTPRELYAALSDETCVTILVPAKAVITRDTIQRACELSGRETTIFREEVR